MQLLNPGPSAKAPAERFTGDVWVDMLAQGAHLAISEANGDPSIADVDWGEHVTDDEYRKAANTR